MLEAETPIYYGIRLLAYLLILWAIAEKRFLPRCQPPEDE